MLNEFSKVDFGNAKMRNIGIKRNCDKFFYRFILDVTHYLLLVEKDSAYRNEPVITLARTMVVDFNKILVYRLVEIAFDS